MQKPSYLEVNLIVTSSPSSKTTVILSERARTSPATGFWVDLQCGFPRVEKTSNTGRKLVVTLGTEFPLLQQRPQLACPVSLVAVSKAEEGYRLLFSLWSLHDTFQHYESWAGGGGCQPSSSWIAALSAFGCLQKWASPSTSDEKSTAVAIVCIVWGSGF